jgi:hypothetical protein
MPEEQKLRLFMRVSDGLFSTIKVLLFVWLASIVTGNLRDVLIAFAGKQTDASVVIQLVAKLQLDRWIAYIFGTGGIAYGYAQNKLRRRTINRLSGHGAELESRLYPERTSSALTSDGKTNVRDRG